MAVVIAVVLLAAGGTGATGASDRTVTVLPGQTLSHVAVRELPSLPLGTAVAELQLANRLNTTHVHAGQVLRIPENP